MGGEVCGAEKSELAFVLPAVLDPARNIPDDSSAVML